MHSAFSYFKESPRWLLSKGRTEQAYQVVFNKKPAKTDREIHQAPSRKEDEDRSKIKSKGLFFEIIGLYRTAKLRRSAIICHFAFFVVSFSYYVTGKSTIVIFILAIIYYINSAINADNLSANRVVYVSATGIVDFLGYVGSILWLTYVGRKWGCFSFYALASACMLLLLVIPRNETTAVVSIAMLGRLGVSSSYAIINLYTTELFPTEVRTTAIGVSSMFGHTGSMMAPFAVDFLVNKQS